MLYNIIITINQNLEALAKQLYDYWFVQFDFPNEEGKPYKSSGGRMVWCEELQMDIPETWNVCRLSEFICKNNTGDWGADEYSAKTPIEVGCIRGADIVKLNELPKRYIKVSNKTKLLSEWDVVIEVSGGSPVQATGRSAFITPGVIKRNGGKLTCSNFCHAFAPTCWYDTDNKKLSGNTKSVQNDSRPGYHRQKWGIDMTMKQRLQKVLAVALMTSFLSTSFVMGVSEAAAAAPRGGGKSPSQSQQIRPAVQKSGGNHAKPAVHKDSSRHQGPSIHKSSQHRQAKPVMHKGGTIHHGGPVIHKNGQHRQAKPVMHKGGTIHHGGPVVVQQHHPAPPPPRHHDDHRSMHSGDWLGALIIGGIIGAVIANNSHHTADNVEYVYAD